MIFAIEEIGRSFEKEQRGLMMRTVVVACLVCIARARQLPLLRSRRRVAADAGASGCGLPVIGVAGGLLGGGFARAVVDDDAARRAPSRRRPYVVAGSLGLAWRCSACSPTAPPTAAATSRRARSCCAVRALPWTYPLAKAAASFLALISAIPGGLFTPSLSVGAGLGDSSRLSSPTDEPRRAMVLLAMGAYFCRRRAEPDHGWRSSSSR